MHILLSEVWHSMTTVMMINYCEYYLLVQVLFLYFVITLYGHFYHSFTPLICKPYRPSFHALAAFHLYLCITS